MERSCDFCVGLRPVVFCEADAAHLCFPCDSKVHSANALSKRHPRLLLCESCRIHPAYAHCIDHRKLMCRGCDQIHHDLASEHKKKGITSYTGCPSAKELAEGWGFDLRDLDSSLNLNVGGSSVVCSMESLRSSVSEEFKVGSGISPIKINKRGQQYNNSVVLQQISDLRKHQLTKGNFRFSKSDQEQVDAASKNNNGWKISDNDDRHVQHSNFHIEGNLDEGMKPKPYSSLFSQVDQLAVAFSGDSLWQSKSSIQSDQLWSQNMQDLGVCDELRSMDDLSMPDFDLTFQNYEELFKGEEEHSTALIDDNISTGFDPSIGIIHTQENSCNSTETDGIRGIQSDSGETVFIRHKDKKGGRHETQAGYNSNRKVKSLSMKRVKSKASNAEGSESPGANGVMTRNF